MRPTGKRTGSFTEKNSLSIEKNEYKCRFYPFSAVEASNAKNTLCLSINIPHNKFGNCDLDEKNLDISLRGNEFDYEEEWNVYDILVNSPYQVPITKNEAQDSKVG